MSTSSNLSRLFFASITALAASGGVAAADGALSTTRDTRDGATFGVGLGGGHIGCQDADGNDCDGDGANEAGGVNVRAGFMLNPRLALAGDLWGMAHTEDRLTVSQVIVAGVVRGWVAPRLWVQGGLGIARSAVELDLGDLGTVMSESDVVPAVVAGIGVEAIASEKLALDIELKGGSGLYEDDIQVYNVSLGAAVSFY